MSSTPHTYQAGETVEFQGREATVIKASKPKRDMWGHMVQSLEIGRYDGMITSYIGSEHSELHPVEVSA